MALSLSSSKSLLAALVRPCASAVAQSRLAGSATASFSGRLPRFQQHVVFSAAQRPWEHGLACWSRRYLGSGARSRRDRRAESRASAVPGGSSVEGESVATAVEDGVTERPTTVLGRVLTAQANFVRIEVSGWEEGDDVPEAPPPKGELLCNVRAILKKMEQRVLVGDRVRVVNIDWEDGRGFVDAVFPRTSEVRDPKVANVDHMVLAFAFDRPPFEPFQATKFLVAAEATNLPVTVLLNKADLVSEEEAEAVLERIRSWGYTALPMSAAKLTGMDALRERLQGRTSVVAGPSGVGKSSLLNAIRLGVGAEDVQMYGDAREYAEITPEDASRPSSSSDHGDASEDGDSGSDESDSGSDEGDTDETYEMIATQAVSARRGTGTHTTRHVTLLKVPGGGLLADTPGFNLPTLQAVPSSGVAACFPEVRRILEESRCGFRNCTHMREPKCAVRSTEWERHAYYERLLEEVLEREERELKKLQMSKKRREGNVKTKQKRGGVVQTEVRLESKKYRRMSRKAVKQEFYNSLGEDGEYHRRRPRGGSTSR